MKAVNSRGVLGAMQVDPSVRTSRAGAGIRVPRLTGWGPLLLLCLWAAVACSRGGPPEETVAGATAPDVVELKLVATASVLITESPERPAVPITSIQVTPSAVVVDLGETVDLSAQAFGPDGQPLSDIEFVWSTTDPRAGAVSKDGKYRAGLRPGEFDHSISVTGLQNTPEGVKFANAFASITVVGVERPLNLATVMVIPGNPTLYTKQIFRLRAVAFDGEGVIIPGVNFVWTLNEPTLGRLNDLGLLTVKAREGVYENAVSVTGIWDGAKLSVSIDIRVAAAPEADDFLAVHALPQRFFLDPGDRMQFRAVALNGLGELVAGSQLRWEMVNLDAGTVDGSGNFIAGQKPGIYTEAVKVEAMVPGESGFVRASDFTSVVIREKESSRRLHTLISVPGTVSVARGGRVALTGRAVDESGEPVENVSFYWELTKEGVGELSETGSFQAGSTPGFYAGALLLTAEQTVGDETSTRTRSVDVVISGTLSRAQAHPSLATIAPGRSVHFSLTGWDENDIRLPGLVVLWSVADERVGIIDPFGNFTAGAAPGLYEGAIRAEVIQRLPE